MRNHWLDFCKLIAIIIVAFWHTEWIKQLHHGYLPVEMFFIISGYFIYKASRKGQRIMKFVQGKALRLIPTMSFVLLLYVFLFVCFPVFSPKTNTPSILLSYITQLFLLQKIGIYEILNIDDVVITLDGPAWYLSVYFWGGILLFLICGIKKFKNIILASIIGVFYIWIFIFSDEGIDKQWGYQSVFYMPLWRGIAGMGLGASIGMSLESHSLRAYLSRNFVGFNILSSLCLLISFYCCFTPFNLDWLGILSFIIVTFNFLTPGGLSDWFNRFKYASIVPDISLEILLLHTALSFKRKVEMQFPYPVQDESGKILYVVCQCFTSIVKCRIYLFLG